MNGINKKMIVRSFQKENAIAIANNPVRMQRTVSMSPMDYKSICYGIVRSLLFLLTKCNSINKS